MRQERNPRELLTLFQSTYITVMQEYKMLEYILDYFQRFRKLKFLAAKSIEYYNNYLIYVLF